MRKMKAGKTDEICVKTRVVNGVAPMWIFWSWKIILLGEAVSSACENLCTIFATSYEAIIF